MNATTVAVDLAKSVFQLAVADASWKVIGGLGVTVLPRNVGFDKIGELCERLLPAEVAHFKWNDFRYSLLHNTYLGSARNLLQGHRYLHFSRQVRIVKLVGIADEFAWHQFSILSAE